MYSQIHADHFTPNQSIEDSLKFLEGDGEVTNEDMGALLLLLLLLLGFSNPMLLSLFTKNFTSAVFLSICDSTDLLLLLMTIIQMCFALFSLKFGMTASSTVDKH